MKTSTVLILAGATLIFMTCSCRVNHVVSGKAQTENKVTAELLVRHPICERDDFTPEQALECIRLSNEISVKVEAGEDTGETIKSLLDLIGAQAEEPVTPTNVMGGI